MDSVVERTGPLAGVRIVELWGAGPAPFAGMLLSDMGADVLLVDRLTEGDLRLPAHRYRLTYRNRRSLRVDLKNPAAVDLLLGVLEHADGFIEGFRPGVVERLGLGPEACLARNPRLVYGRATGWGQTGPWAQRAGFDLNYLALTGALAAIGAADSPPPPPLLLVGDFGGGGPFLAMGMVAALFEARQSGQGQVVDAAIVDGVHAMMAYVHGGLDGETWVNRRESNIVDGGDFRYRTYACADGLHLAVAAPLRAFLDALTETLGLDLAALHLGPVEDPATWPVYRDLLAQVFATRPRDEWMTVFDSDQHCVTPVLDPMEARSHVHNAARGAFVDLDGVAHPAPAPRFSRTPSRITGPPPEPGAGGVDAVVSWGADEEAVRALLASGAIA